MAYRYEGEEQESLYPEEAERITEEDQGRVISMRYRYRGRAGNYRYRARARHITPDGITLPAVPPDRRDEEWSDNPVKIDGDIPGWAYPEDDLTTRHW